MRAVALLRAAAALMVAGAAAGCATPPGGPSSLLYRPDAARWEPPSLLPEPERTAAAPDAALRAAAPARSAA